MSADIEIVSIKLQTGVYGQFRNLNNRIWFALGEYVDNAVQSFENNRERLIQAGDGKYQFEVRIDVDWSHDTITIKDNAAGIDTKNFKRAFEPANIPVDTTGLNEFGMGMKTASIWLADVWLVRSGALGEEVTRTVQFDLHKVLKEEREDLTVKNTAKSKNSHFTELVLKKLSRNAPSAHQMDKIKRHLASIYRKFIRVGDLKLFVNNEELLYEDPDVLVAPYYSNPNSKPKQWKKSIKFSSGKYRVKGFIGILSKMSTNEAGISLFRRGRVVEGSHDEKYRPKSLSGQPGSPRYKRIFGELELDGFAVSFNKGSFQEQDDLDALMEAIKIEISARELNLINQAEKFIKPKGTENNVKVGKGIVKLLKANKSDDRFTQQKSGSFNYPIDSNLDALNTKFIKRAKVIDSDEEIIEVKDGKYKLKLNLITEPRVSNIYSVEISEDELFDKKAIYTINLAHPFFNRFEKLRTKNHYQPIVTMIRALVLGEIISQSQGTRNGSNIRMNFNFLLRYL